MAALSNHITCTACKVPVRRGDAVIRGDLHDQRGWHPACYTVDRAVAGVDVEAVGVDARIGMSLSERLQLARVGSSR